MIAHLMKITAMTFIFLAFAALAGEQQPIGSKTSWSVVTNNNNIVYHFTNHTSGSNWIVNGGSPPIPLPYVWKAPDSGIIFYVESDGRHVTAINPDGKVLWHRDPFADAKLEFYRTKTPRIVYIGKAAAVAEKYFAKQGKKIIRIRFNSSQFGEMDVKTGDFTFGGQD